MPLNSAVQQTVGCLETVHSVPGRLTRSLIESELSISKEDWRYGALFVCFVAHRQYRHNNKT